MDCVSYFQPIEHPVRTNQIPRQIPDQSTQDLCLELSWKEGVFSLCFFFLLIVRNLYLPLICYIVYFQPIEHPVRTNQIPRQIPDQSVYTRPLPGIVMGGVLPFGCIFIQLFFILNSIWYVEIIF